MQASNIEKENRDTRHGALYRAGAHALAFWKQDHAACGEAHERQADIGARSFRLRLPICSFSLASSPAPARTLVRRSRGTKAGLSPTSSVRRSPPPRAIPGEPTLRPEVSRTHPIIASFAAWPNRPLRSINLRSSHRSRSCPRGHPTKQSRLGAFRLLHS